MSTSIKRRTFLKQIGVTTSAFGLGVVLPYCSLVKEEPMGIIELFKANIDESAQGIGLNPYLFIEPSGKIIIFAHRPEMGQGTFQSIPLLIAEELGVELADITIKLPPIRKGFVGQGVGGSASIRTMWMPMRKIGATAREMLRQAAANHWDVTLADCEALNGKIFQKGTEKFLTYGALVEAASQLAIPENVPLKTTNQFNQVGKSIPRPDIPLKVTGEANFGIDMKVEGMVYAVIERSPCFNGKVKSINDQLAIAIPGVQEVVKCIRPIGIYEREGVAVIADNYWAALQGRKALKIEWEEFSHLPSTAELFTTMRATASKAGVIDTKVGDFDTTFEKADTQLTASYESPFLAHAPMEPVNTLVWVKADSCEIWSAVQHPLWTQSEAAKLLGWNKDKIQVHCPFIGGSFGRKGLPDFNMEGVLLSKQLQKPVKIVWTRADDIQQGPFRPNSFNQLHGALDAQGQVIAFHHKVITPSFDHALLGVYEPDKIIPARMMNPIGKPFYDIPHFKTSYGWVDASPIPLMWWRSVYCSTNVFGQECFIDELANEANKDPVDFRLNMLDNQPKYKEFLQFLAEKANWNRQLPSNWGRGIAITHCFETTAGQVVEISHGEKGIQIERVITAIDCGIAVDPENIKAQCEGSVIMGLTAALKDGLTFENGRVKESNFHDYRVLRINEVPKLETFIMPSMEVPTGVGEPALPTVAPALANAIFDLTGKRIRKLPIVSMGM